MSRLLIFKPFWNLCMLVRSMWHKINCQLSSRQPSDSKWKVWRKCHLLSKKRDKRPADVKTILHLFLVSIFPSSETPTKIRHFYQHKLFCWDSIYDSLFSDFQLQFLWRTPSTSLRNYFSFFPTFFNSIIFDFSILCYLFTSGCLCPSVLAPPYSTNTVLFFPPFSLRVSVSTFVVERVFFALIF